MANTDFKSVDQYIASRPVAVQGLLERVRGILRKAMPGAEEVISYQIPAYKLHGSNAIFFAGWKEHYSLYPATAGVVAAFEKQLAAYEVTKGTIRFPFADGVPAKLIAGIAKVRAKEAAELEATKAAAKQKKKKPLARKKTKR